MMQKERLTPKIAAKIHNLAYALKEVLEDSDTVIFIDWNLTGYINGSDIRYLNDTLFDASNKINNGRLKIAND